MKPGAGGIEDIGGCGKAHLKNVGLWYGVGNGSLRGEVIVMVETVKIMTTIYIGFTLKITDCQLHFSPKCSSYSW